MKAFLWSCWVCLLIGVGTKWSVIWEPPVEVDAVLGGEVTFSVQIKDGFEIGDMRCLFKRNTIARMKPGKKYLVTDTRFTGRLSAGDEKGSFKIRNLRTEDSGLYSIEMFNKRDPAEGETKHYELKIFSRVRPQIFISADSASGTCLISFNCTVNDTTYVSYSWSGEKVGPSVEPVLSLNLTESESNLNICCTVKNPASNASECVVPRQYCFTGATAFPCAACTCGYPERIIACAVATVLSVLVGFIVYRCELRKEQDQCDKENSN